MRIPRSRRTSISTNQSMRGYRFVYTLASFLSTRKKRRKKKAEPRRLLVTTHSINPVVRHVWLNLGCDDIRLPHHLDVVLKKSAWQRVNYKPHSEEDERRSALRTAWVRSFQNEELTDGLRSISCSSVSSKRPWHGETPPSGLVPGLPSLHATSTTRTPGRLVERPEA